MWLEYSFMKAICSDKWKLYLHHKLTGNIAVREDNTSNTCSLFVLVDHTWSHGISIDCSPIIQITLDLCITLLKSFSECWYISSVIKGSSQCVLLIFGLYRSNYSPQMMSMMLKCFFFICGLTPDILDTFIFLIKFRIKIFDLFC